MPLKLDILANTRQFVSEMRKAGASTDDVSEALDDMAKDGAKAGEKLERSFKDLSSAAQVQGKKAGDNLKKGIGAGFDDVKKEAQSSGAEAAASFTGDLNDIPGVLQEVAANLGPAGIAGGAIIGAITGVALASVTAWDEKIRGIKDATASMWEDAAQSGDTFLKGEAIRAEATRILWDDAFKLDFENARAAGVEASDLAIALATGVGETYDKVHEQFMTQKDKEKAKQAEANSAALQSGARVVDNYNAQEAAVDKTITTLEEKSKATEDGKKKAQEAAAVEKQLQSEIQERVTGTRVALEDLARGVYTPTVKPVLDRSSVDASLRQVVRDINGTVAYIKVGQQILR